MKFIRKWLGLIWMGIGPVAIFFLLKMAAAEIAAKPMIDTKIQWGVFVVIAVPIAIGMVIFGYYVFKEEYDA
jgi:hypothetical protein